MFRLFIFMAVCLSFPALSSAQEAATLPELPAPIQNLVDEGAQIRFLGRDQGLDGWLTIKNGQEQYFYVQPDGSAFVMGVMFNAKGEMITVDQVQRLRNTDEDLLDTLAGEREIGDGSNAQTQNFDFQTPSERLYHDIENSNWVALGQANAPVVYSFIDPQCPHCHAFIDDIRARNYFESGQVQLRMIPVGFREETRAQAAFLMATPNPQERWFKHMDGDEAALPARADLNQQGVQRNLAIMQSWKFNVTPMIVYRAKDGSVKIVRGKPKDLAAMVGDLAPQQ